MSKDAVRNRHRVLDLEENPLLNLKVWLDRIIRLILAIFLVELAFFC